MHRSRILPCVLLLAAVAAPAHGQRAQLAPPSAVVPVPAASVPGHAPELPAALPAAQILAPAAASDMRGAGPAGTGTLLALGAFAAGSSAVLGAVLGYGLDRSGGGAGENPGLGGLIVGWVLGPAIVTPAVVHIANRGHGSGGAAYAGAGLLAAAGLTAAASGEAMLAIPLAAGAPLLQLVSAVVTTRATEPRQ